MIRELEERLRKADAASSRPLDGLVEKTAADPGAPFALDALERLAALKKEDCAAFEALRVQLKKAGCRFGPSGRPGHGGWRARCQSQDLAA